MLCSHHEQEWIERIQKVYLKGTDQTKANSEVSVNITAIFHSANGQNSGQKENQNSGLLLFLKISNNSLRH